VLAFSLLYTAPKFFELRLEKIPLTPLELGFNASASLALDQTETGLNASVSLDKNGTNEAEGNPSDEGKEHFRWALIPTEMRRSKLYIRIYLIWMNLFVQVI